MQSLSQKAKAKKMPSKTQAYMYTSRSIMLRERVQGFQLDFCGPG